MQLEVETRVGFTQFDLSDELYRALEAMGYSEPTEIQRLSIPQLFEGHDLIGQAQTGTGKTAAFGIPIAELVCEEERFPQHLVLAPTRELAVQIAAELRRLTATLDVTVATIYGGVAFAPQLDTLARGPQIVVGTPGRILDHIRRGNLDLRRVNLVILDEADRMLDMGFMPDVERILSQTPRSRQTALFSATMPLVVRILSRRYMRHPRSVSVRPEEPTVAEVEQRYYEVAEKDKSIALMEILGKEEPERCLVFCRTQAAVDRVVRYLKRAGVDAEAIHGSLSQSHREQALGRFRDGSLRVLVATNVAARGLDVPEVSHVVNFDIPDETESYIHRIGRTARMGRRGTALTFVGEWDHEAFDSIKELANGQLERGALDMYTR